MFARVHPGERWVTYVLVDKFHVSFQTIPALRKAPSPAGHASGMLSSDRCGRRRSAEDREDGGVFVLLPRRNNIPPPFGSTTPRQNTEPAFPDVRTPQGRAPAAPRPPSLPHRRGETGARCPSGMAPLSPPCPATPASAPASGGGQASGERQGLGGAAREAPTLRAWRVRGPQPSLPGGVAEDRSPGKGEA